MRRSLIILAFVLTGFGVARADGYVMVRNAKASQGHISPSDAKALYLGKQKLWNGAPVVVAVRAEDDPVFGQFAESVFGVSAKTLLTKIKQEVFKGEMAKPFKATGDDDLVRFVASNPSAIGVVSAAAARTLPAGVAVLELR